MAKRILIVDDDAELCVELAEILKDEGFEVEVVFDGRQAMERIEKCNYNLLVLDFKMPGLSGIEILRQLKEKKHCCKLLMISGRPNIQNAISAENLTDLLAGIMQKPFSIEEFLEKVRASVLLP